jgi:hypothetical protein
VTHTDFTLVGKMNSRLTGGGNFYAIELIFWGVYRFITLHEFKQSKKI